MSPRGNPHFGAENNPQNLTDLLANFLVVNSIAAATSEGPLRRVRIRSSSGPKGKLLDGEKSPVDGWRSAALQATVGGRQRRMSTKKDSLKLAEDVAKDWFLTLQGKARAGLLKSGRTFADAAKKFMAEYGTITKGRRSPKWVAGHEARLRLTPRPGMTCWKSSRSAMAGVPPSLPASCPWKLGTS
jgi:hypothetical protein